MQQKGAKTILTMVNANHEKHSRGTVPQSSNCGGSERVQRDGNIKAQRLKPFRLEMPIRRMGIVGCWLWLLKTNKNVTIDNEDIGIKLETCYLYLFYLF